MLLKEIENNIFQQDNSIIYYSFGRDLMNDYIPRDKKILLLLDPLFVEIFEKNLNKLISASVSDITICIIVFEGIDLDVINKYFNCLDKLLENLSTVPNVKFITPETLELKYMDGANYNFRYPVFVQIVNSFEKQYLEQLESIRGK